MITTLSLYALMTHFVSLFALLSIGMGRKFYKLVSVIAVIFLTYFVSLISLPDYEIYAQGFRNIDLGQSISEQYSLFYGEYFYFLINYIFRFFTDDFNAVRSFLVGSALILKFLFLLRWGSFYTLSFVFYMALIFYPDSYMIRSTIASSIILLGIWSVFNNKPSYLFFMFIFIASGFHISALIALPIWFFRNVNITKTSAYILLGIIFVIGIVGAGHMLSNFLIYALGDVHISERLADYIESGKYSGEVGVVRVSVLLFTLIAVLFIAYKNAIEKYTEHYNFILAMVLYGLFLLVGLNDFEILADRLFRLFAFFLPIAFGYIMRTVSRGDTLYVSIFLMVILNFVPYVYNQGPFTLIS